MKPLTQVAEISVNYCPAHGWENQPQIFESNDAYIVLKDFFPSETIHLQESFVLLYINQNNRVMAAYRMSQGGITGTVVDIRLILATALKVAATGIIIAHNHPSGNTKPSNSDRQLTHKLYEAAKLMDIVLADHLIITPIEGKFYSFADESDLFTFKNQT